MGGQAGTSPYELDLFTSGREAQYLTLRLAKVGRSSSKREKEK